jgi:hypothetical protein
MVVVRSERLANSQSAWNVIEVGGRGRRFSWREGEQVQSTV